MNLAVNIKKTFSVLIVEDDKFIAMTLQRKLESYGFVVYHTFKGDAVKRMVIRHSPDCILLDINIPNLNGFEVCTQLRDFYQSPIIFLTSDESTQTEIQGLDLGADDFIQKSKPFEIILSRINRFLKFQNRNQQNVGAIGIGKFNFSKKLHICEYKNKRISLSNEEFELLYLMLIHKDQLITREYTYQTLKGISYDGFGRSMDMTISRLKNKLIGASFSQNVIETIRGKGYRFNSAEIWAENS